MDPVVIAIPSIIFASIIICCCISCYKSCEIHVDRPEDLESPDTPRPVIKV